MTWKHDAWQRLHKETCSSAVRRSVCATYTHLVHVNSSYGVLRFLDFTLPFELCTDASHLQPEHFWTIETAARQEINNLVLSSITVTLSPEQKCIIPQQRRSTGCFKSHSIFSFITWKEHIPKFSQIPKNLRISWKWQNPRARSHVGEANSSSLNLKSTTVGSLQWKMLMPYSGWRSYLGYLIKNSKTLQSMWKSLSVATHSERKNWSAYNVGSYHSRPQPGCHDGFWRTFMQLTKQFTWPKWKKTDTCNHAMNVK